MRKPSPAPIVNAEAGQSTVEFFGLNFNAIDENMAVRQIRHLEQKSGYFYVVTPNVDHIVQLDKSTDGSLIEAYQGADLIICDSRILSFLAQRSGFTLDAVPGSDLTRELLRTGKKGWRLAMIGGDLLLHEKLQTIYPDYEWVFHEPPMGLRRNPDARISIAEFIEEKKADMVLFAIGAPQSEITCREIALRGKATGVALCIGASLEFLTGAKRRAPHWMQRTGLEWLYRLCNEPSRLWRRYLVEGPKIFVIWWRWKKLKRK